VKGSVAQYLVQEILKHSTDNSEPEVQGPAEHQSGINPTRHQKEEAIRPHLSASKVSKAQAHISRDGPGVHTQLPAAAPSRRRFVTCQHDDVTLTKEDSL